MPLATVLARSAIPSQGGLSFTAVAAGGDAGGGFTCGLDEDSLGVHCWGQMGATGSPSTTPVRVDGLPAGEVQGVTAGGAHACALMADGTAYCWGENGDGQLGDGSLDPSDMVAAPVTLPTTPEMVLGRFAVLSAGARHTCGIIDEGIRLHACRRAGLTLPAVFDFARTITSPGLLVGLR